MKKWKNPPPPAIEIQSDVPLAPMTTMRVGGPAEFFTKVTTTDALREVVQWAQAESLPYLILGGGSNILISDAGVRGLVIQNRCREVTVFSSFMDVQGEHVAQELVAASGAAMAGTARTSVRNGLTGLEWAVSVPGTIGGAIVNNAGAHGGEVKDSLVEAVVIDENGTIIRLSVTELGYSYRHSVLKSAASPHRAALGAVVLSGTFQLAVAPATEIGARADQYLKHRRRTQPVEPSLGSTFVNPTGDFAGRLIEAAGLKGTKIGGIQVSEQHANFIVNPGGVGSGKAADVVALIELIQESVETRFGTRLKPEVQLMGEWGEWK